jgi:hypothetical protein
MARRILIAGGGGWLGIVLLVLPVWATERISQGDWVRVISDSPAKIEREVVGTIPGGTVAEAKYVQGEWVFLEVGDVRGWVHRSRVERISHPEPEPVCPPPPVSQEPAGKPNSGTTLELLSRYMDRLGYKHATVTEPLEQEGVIIAGFRFVDKDLQVTVQIDPIVEKGCLLFNVPRIFHAPVGTTSPDRLLELLKAIGYFNYSIILGKFCYDPRDGEVSFGVNIAIDDSVVPFAQFKHCLDVVLSELEDKVPKLRAILAGEASASDFMKPLLQIQPARFFTTSLSDRERSALAEEVRLIHLEDAVPRE